MSLLRIVELPPVVFAVGLGPFGEVERGHIPIGGDQLEELWHRLWELSCRMIEVDDHDVAILGEPTDG